MLTALKHRGPDSTGFAVYGNESKGDYVMRFILAEQEAMSKGFDMKKKKRALTKKKKKRKKPGGGAQLCTSVYHQS
jgi:glutamate synthase domain-containing protein 1